MNRHTILAGLSRIATLPAVSAVPTIPADERVKRATRELAAAVKEADLAEKNKFYF